MLIFNFLRLYPEDLGIDVVRKKAVGIQIL